jgi:hypothetical protein
LGLSEATVKRMVGKGALPSRKDRRSWRTPAHSLLQKLREGRPRSKTLREAALAGDDAECLAQLIEQHVGGRGLGSMFDELLRFDVPLGFIERAQPLAELPESKARRVVRAALLTGGELDSRMAACLFRARRIEVLTTLRQLDDESAAALVRQSRPEWFWAGASDLPLPRLSAAATQTGCRLLRLGSGAPHETFIAGLAGLERMLQRAT